MRTFAYLLIFLAFFTAGNAQSLNAYKYVVVPEKYDFLEENEYQLNALTAFLFDKHGFEVFYKEDIPDDIEACDILFADVLNESSFFSTKVRLTLEDCNQKMVFTSEEGKSREKDFKRGFHEALRDTFQSKEILEYAYEAPEEEKSSTAPEIVNRNETSNPNQVEIEEASEEIVLKGQDFPKEFINAGTEYKLEKTASGYSLFKKGDQEVFATLLKSGGGDNFIYSSENLQGNAYFGPSGNLMVDYIVPNTKQLVTLEYVAQY